jgi:anti-anti-sigma factor
MESENIQFNFSQNDKDDALYLVISGELAGADALRLEAVILSLITKAKKTGKVVLDLRDTAHLDSKGIGLCISTFMECNRQGISLSIHTGAISHRILTGMNLERVMTIELLY